MRRLAIARVAIAAAFQLATTVTAKISAKGIAASGPCCEKAQKPPAAARAATMVPETRIVRSSRAALFSDMARHLVYRAGFSRPELAAFAEIDRPGRSRPC